MINARLPFLFESHLHFLFTMLCFFFGSRCFFLFFIFFFFFLFFYDFGPFGARVPFRDERKKERILEAGTSSRSADRSTIEAISKALMAADVCAIIGFP